MYSISRTRLYLATGLVALLLAFAQQAWCVDNDSFEDSLATHASNAIGPLLAVGELSLLASGKNAKPEMIQGAKALVATTVLTEMLKHVVREKRPFSDSLTSFPSGHTSSAFAMAAVVADYHPKYKWLAYGTAAAVGWSRVDVGAHRWRDVIAGAALGYFTAKRYTNQGLELSPGGAAYAWKW